MYLLVYVPAYAGKGAGKTSGIEHNILEYGAKLILSAESSTSSTKIWSKGDTTALPKIARTQLQQEITAEVLKIPMSGFLCRLQDDRILCYSPVSRRCVILREDRSDKPDELQARRGGHDTGVCKGFEMYEEI